MIFNSVSFGLFLSVVLVLHRILPWRYARVMLVVASYVFYGFAIPWYCLLLLTSTLVDFTVARRMPASGSTSRKLLLATSLLVNLSLLGTFKYADFAIANANRMLVPFGLDALGPLELLLPVGISFYTFQTISYTLDVYWGTTRPTDDFIGFALYVAFFPQLMAGPIERANSLLPQLQRPRPVERADLELGFQRALWGLAKKVVVADRLGIYVDAVYQDVGAHGGLTLLLATASFGLQLYFDFSGYCDIAIGVARMMGIRLNENFDWPLLARNPIDFWNRWHITLTTWFRDYVLGPIVRRGRGSVASRLLGVIVALGLMGLWHGAAWHFVTMGLGAGLAVAAYEMVFRVTGIPRNRPLLGTGAWATALALPLMWVHGLVLAALFRAPSLGQAAEVLAGIVVRPWSWEPRTALHLGLLLLVALPLVTRPLQPLRWLERPMAPPLRAALWCGLTLAVLYGAVDATDKFIYFEF